MNDEVLEIFNEIHTASVMEVSDQIMGTSRYISTEK